MPPPAPPLPSPIVVILATVMMSLFVGMFFAWAWAIGRLRAGRAILPENTPRLVPWGGGSVLAGLVAMFGVSVGVATAYTRATGRTSETSQHDLMLVGALINVVLLVVVPLILRWTAHARTEDYGLTWGRLGRDVRVGFVAFLLIAPVIYSIQAVAVQVWDRNKHPVEQMMLENFTGRVAFLAIVSAVVLAPAVEELLFRGLFQGWLARRLLGTPDRPGEPGPGIEGEDPEQTDGNPPATEPRSVLAPRVPGAWPSILPVLLTSLIFALVHMPQWPAPVAIFLLSLGLGTLYQRTGSLVASFVLHAAFNGLSTLALILVALHPVPIEKEAVPIPLETRIARPHAGQ